MTYEPKTGGYIHRQLITEVEQNTDEIVDIMELFSRAASSPKAKELINSVLVLAYKNQRALAKMLAIAGNEPSQAETERGGAGVSPNGGVRTSGGR